MAFGLGTRHLASPTARSAGSTRRRETRTTCADAWSRSIDGEPPGDAHGGDVDEEGYGTLDFPRLHQLVRQSDRIRDRTFEITFIDPDAEVYVFTFG